MNAAANELLLESHPPVNDQLRVSRNGQIADALQTCVQLHLFLSRLRATNNDLYTEIATFFGIPDGDILLIMKQIKSKLLNNSYDTHAARRLDSERGRAWIVEVDPDETPTKKIIDTIRNFLYAISKAKTHNVFRMNGAGENYLDYLPTFSLKFSAVLGILNCILYWLQGNKEKFLTERYAKAVRLVVVTTRFVLSLAP